jgi:ketosteroid isomerase-like protein
MAFAGPVEDRLAIRELLETYGDAVIRRDAAAWGETWMSDAVWEIFGHSVHGRAAIVSFWQQAMTQFPLVVFLTVPRSIEISGDVARISATTFEGLDTAAGGRAVTFGAYADEAVRQDGCWRFSRRAWTPLIQQEIAPT